MSKSICIVGLGYVGSPLAFALSQHFDIIGFDKDSRKVNELIKERKKRSELYKAINFTSNITECANAEIFIIAVPTPVNIAKKPDFSFLIDASESVGTVLKKNDVVIYESTVYPGATEEICIPVLEKFSGLNCLEDFGVGYSPERINPGDNENTLENCIKVISATDSRSLKLLEEIYSSIVHAGLYPVSTIRVAEAAKIVENTQRDVNIALFNELSQLFNRLGINSKEVFDAASSKWNFHRYAPGLVGGHCISVDPYYLIQKALEFDFHSKIIASGREVNDGMVSYVYDQIIDLIIEQKYNLADIRVLVIGSTFKEDCPDTRNSKSIELIQKINKKFQTDVFDPIADYETLPQTVKNIMVNDPKENKYDVIVFAVAHNVVLQSLHELVDLKREKSSLIIDLKNLLPKDQANFQL